MTIAAVDAFHLQVAADLPSPAAGAPSLPHSLPIHLVRLTCDDGATAWGEARCGSAGALDDAIELLAPILLDADPLDRGALWERMVDRLSGLKDPLEGGAGALSALDIAMPDVRLCGGITGLLKIAELARWFNVQISPHNASSQIATIASSHAAVTLRNCLISEANLTGSRASAGLLEEPVQLEDGFITVPDGPGLGITISEEFVSRHAVE